jgi:hypothetical protein
MSDEADRKSFWTTLPGILTATAALITATGGFVAVLIQAGVIGGDGSENVAVQVTTSAGPSWAAQANKICERANDAIDDLPEPTSSNADALGVEAMLKYGTAATKISRRMLRDLTELSPPADQAADVTEFVKLGARMNAAADEMFAAFAIGDVLAVQDAQHELSAAGQRFDAKAIELGATTCAEGASLGGAELPGG